VGASVGRAPALEPSTRYELADGSQWTRRARVSAAVKARSPQPGVVGLPRHAPAPVVGVAGLVWAERGPAGMPAKACSSGVLTIAEADKGSLLMLASLAYYLAAFAA
jgi:hypothetical protein